MGKTAQRKYFRITKAERVSIERALDGRQAARKIARDLSRSASSIVDEIKRNRTVCKGPGKGESVSTPPEGQLTCPKLEAWPWVCNGCKYRRYHCSYKWRCEYSATRAQFLADKKLADSRKGVNQQESEFCIMMDMIRFDTARGLSPYQICTGRSEQFKVHPTTVYRWIAKGYGGMCDVDLRRKAGYKPRKENTVKKITSHGKERSYEAFSSLSEDIQGAVCEMDTVIGKACDKQCLLTLFVRPCKLQIVLLLPEKTSSAVASALDMLERCLGTDLFQQLFGIILTDNGTEFSDPKGIEHSIFSEDARCQVYYCDPRQSQQKGACEKNHVEIRKILPKGRGISFDALEGQDVAFVMSQVNSQPRASLIGRSSLGTLRAVSPRACDVLCMALGMEEVVYKELRLTPEALNQLRLERGLTSL